jgi:hypothetical protein
MRKLIPILLLAAPLAAQNYGSYNNAPVARNGFLRSASSVKGNVLQDSSLVGWWPLTAANGSTARDMSGNGNDGTWSGTKAGTNGYWSAGKTGAWSGYFNSTNNLINVTNKTLNITGPITMMAWVNTTMTSGYSAVVSKGGGSFRDYYFALRANNTLSIYIGGASGYGGQPVISPTWSTTNWTHVAVTANGANIVAYINGQQAASVASTAVATNSSGSNFYIGNDVSIGTYWAKGNMADVRIYNRALSQAEIQAIYNAENH